MRCCPGKAMPRQKTHMSQLCPGVSQTQEISSALGAIFLIFRDSRQAMQKAKKIRQTASAAMSPTGTENVHFTIPMLLKNKATSGLMIRQHPTTPTAVEMVMVGIKVNAVCRINCPVV